MIICYIQNRHGNTIWQIHTILWFSCTRVLNDIGKADIVVNNADLLDSIDILKENNRIAIYEEEWIVRKAYIHGYIRGFEATLTQTIIRIEDRFSILEDKLFYGAFTRSNGTVKAMLESMVATVNAREDTLISVDSDVTDTFSKTFENGEIVGLAIKDARQNKYEFRMEENVLAFKNAVGIDRSLLWADYLEFSRDFIDPNSRSLKNARLVSDIKQMANCAIGRDESVSTQYEDPQSIIERWRIERPITNSGSIAQSAEAFVNERKDSVREYDIEPILNDFFACDVGDTVRVFINTWNPLMFFEWPMKIIEKSFKAWDVNTVSIKVSSGKVKLSTLAERFREINARLTRLELQP